MTTYNPFSLKNKKILVTGASSGIGQGIALTCAQLGAEVYITGRNKERLSQTQGMLVGQGHNSIVADLNIRESLLDLVSSIPSLDGVVHSIGFTKVVPVRLMTRESLEKMMDDNFTATADLTHELLFKNKINNGGSIVFMSSVSSKVGVRGVASYAASKGATNSFMRSLVGEVSKKMIRVNAICPGLVDTPLWGPEGERHQLHELGKLYPFGLGRPEDIGHAAVYLLSGASRWVTGIELMMEGGIVHHV
jgi:NAD(P)-dependent dehydrogenase (short-subunit alcohol dehydrogenase family)